MLMRARNTRDAFTAGQPLTQQDLMRLWRHRFTVIDTVCNYAECQRFGFGPRLLLGRRVDEDTRQRRHLGDPAPVLLTLNFNPHAGTPPRVRSWHSRGSEQTRLRMQKPNITT